MFQIQSQVIDRLKSVFIGAFVGLFLVSANITVALADNESSNASSSSAKGEVIDTKSVEKRQVGQGKAVIEIMKTGKLAFIGRLSLAANAQVPQHRDPTEEYLIIEEGSGIITIDGQKSKVKKGDLIYMPAHAEVSFVNGDQKLVALQVFAGPESATKYNKWHAVKSDQNNR